MKLLIIFSSTQRGGAEEYALTIARAAIKQGWQLHAAFPDQPGMNTLIQDFVYLGVSYYPLNIAEPELFSIKTVGEQADALVPAFNRLFTSRLKATIGHIPRFLKSLYLLFKVKPDAVQIILPWPTFCFSSILACGLLKLPTTLVFQLIPQYVPLSTWQLAIYQWVHRRSQQWVAISENNKQFICETFQIHPGKIICIYNGTSTPDKPELDECARAQIRQKIRQELGLSDNTLILLTVARLGPQKGHNYLIPVIPHIAKAFPNVHFVWIGEGELKASLIQDLESYQVSNKVSMLGYRDDVHRFLLASDLFVFPTYYEGQPFAVLEAMAQGLPVVASATSGIPEVIEHQVHGLLFRTGDSCDLLETLRGALQQPGKMKEMADNAQHRVKDFSETEMTEKNLETIEKLVLSH